MRFHATFGSLWLFVGVPAALGRHSLRYAGMQDRVDARAEHFYAASAPPIESRDTAPQYLNPKTAKFAVNGKTLPEINFDIGESYAGLLPISNKPNDPNQLFFWYFPTTNPAAKNEITIWLNGGPGCSSMAGIISEHGVWTWYGGTFAPVRNPWAWANLTNIVYIDQPVGSGFSVGNVSITNEEELAQQFLGFWDNFVDTFGLQGWKTYVTGESYAGQYVPYITSAMLQSKQTKYNVQGMMVFDPSIGNVVVQKEIPVLAFTRWYNNVFPINDTYRAELEAAAVSCGYNSYMDKYLVFPPSGPQPVTLPNTTSQGLVVDACDVYDSVFENMFYINPCWDIYNVITKCPIPWDNLGFPGDIMFTPPGAPPPYFDRPDVKAAIHAPNITWAECSSEPVFINGTDTSLPSAQTVIPGIIEATNNVVIAHGGLDMVLLANGTMLTIQNMTWNGKMGFQEKPTAPFYVPYALNIGDPTNWAGAGVFGTTHSERGLTWVEVSFSGHQIPEFAPSAAYRMLEVLLGRVQGGMSSRAPYSTDNQPQPQGPLGNGNAPPV